MEEIELKPLVYSQSENENILLPKDVGDCFIFLGETGSGKTSIINLLCNTNNTVGDSFNAETKDIKKEKGEYSNKKNKEPKKYYYCLDTPGFNDTKLSNQKIEDLIKDYLSKDKDIAIKGIIFVNSFLNKKLTSSFWDSFNTIFSIFPMKEFWKHIILCFTHTYVGPRADLDATKKEYESRIKKQFEEKMNELEKSKNIKKIDLNELKILFIDLCSGKDYENLNDGNKKSVDENNKKEKDKLQEIISKFKDEKPMFSSIEKVEGKNQLAFEVDEKKKYIYNIYEVDYEQIIYKDFNGKEIYTCVKQPFKRKDFKNDYTNIFFNNHKRGFCIGATALSILIYGIGAIIPGVNVLEMGWIIPAVIGVLSGGGGTITILTKRGWESTIDKIKNKKILSMEDLKNGRINKKDN